MKFSMNWLARYTSLPMGDKTKMNEIIDHIALQIVDVDERWFIEKDGKILDAVIDIDNKIITNRPYAFGHRGLAREISVMLDQKYTGTEYPTIPTKNSEALKVQIEVKNPEICPRFTALAIKGVKIGPSPDFLKYAVESVGLRSINNLVDITNMIMLDTAQPVHAYDYNKIKDGKMIVRRAKNGEKVTTLDGVERTLHNDILLITDYEKPIGIAGVMGAGNSEIDENTTNILLEIASFHPQNIRMTSKFLKHRTDAATRFEKGIDPTNIPNVMAFMVDLILQICGGKIASEFIDINNLEKSSLRIKPMQMEFNPLRVNKLLGFNITIDFIKKIFDGFGITYEEKDNELWDLEIPTYRPDIKDSADLVEDIGRMYGYQNIPKTIPINQLIAPQPNHKVKTKSIIRKILTASGLDEVVTFSFISEKDARAFSLQNCIKIVNPLSEEYIYLRPTLLPSLAKVVRLNAKNFDHFGIFEIARKFTKKDSNITTYEQDHGESILPNEIETLSLMFYSKRDQKDSIYKLKGALENLCQSIKISNITIRKNGEIFLNNKKIGDIKLLNQSILEYYEIPSAVSYIEIELNEIYQNNKIQKTYKPYSHFQGSKLDYSIFIPKNTPAGSILDSIPTHKWITHKEIIDIHQKDEDNRKSISIRIHLQKIDGNLNDREIYEIGTMIEEKVKQIPNAEIRGGGVTKSKGHSSAMTQIDYKSILVARILAIDPHPNADRLVVTQVTTDGENKYQIVTGATNMKVDDFVPVALPGVAVPGLKNEDGSPVVMRVAKLRGIESYGMLLAGDELGINDDHEGIYILNKEKYKLGDEVKPDELR